MMRADFVELSEQGIDGDLGLLGGVEPFRIQNFLTQCSIEAFVVAMSELDYQLPQQIQKLLADLESFSVYPEFKKSLILRGGTPSGDVANLGYIQGNGQVWTDQTSASLGDLDVAETYLHKLAKALGGEVGEMSGRPYVTHSGKAP